MSGGRHRWWPSVLQSSPVEHGQPLSQCTGRRHTGPGFCDSALAGDTQAQASVTVHWQETHRPRLLWQCTGRRHTGPGFCDSALAGDTQAQASVTVHWQETHRPRLLWQCTGRRHTGPGFCVPVWLHQRGSGWHDSAQDWFDRDRKWY